MPSKPKTALWTSTFREETRSSEWSEWCEQEDFPTGDRFFVLTPRQGTKVLSVNDENDEARLPLTKSGQIDFEAIASWGFDGLRTPCGRCGGLFDTWDCESTVWFNCDWIATVEEV